jgi:hypothetical protein
MSTFDDFLKIVKTTSDSRDYYTILEEHPEFVNMQDASGKTALMHAAMKGYGDSMATLVETHKADVTLKDKDGKTARDYATEWYAENPEEYDNDESVPEYFLGMLKDAELKANQIKGAKDVAALRQTSRDPNIPLSMTVGSYLTGEKGPLPEQVSKVRSKYAGRRKTRRGKKTRGKNKVYRKRTVKK